MKRVLGLLIFLSVCQAWSHARLTFPVPRNNNSGIKTGPCGGLARSANPMVFKGGDTITVRWEETVQHPGRYIFSLSLANDQGFQNNVLATVIDVQDNPNNIPHLYQTQIKLPDIDCPACTFQMIQSMEENPARPTYYYSCADIVIQPSVAAQPPPPPPPAPPTMPPGNEGTFSSSSGTSTSGVKFGQGCSMVQVTSDKTLQGSSLNSRSQQLPSGLYALLCLMLLAIPGALWLQMKRLNSRSVSIR